MFLNSEKVSNLGQTIYSKDLFDYVCTEKAKLRIIQTQVFNSSYFIEIRPFFLVNMILLSLKNIYF